MAYRPDCTAVVISCIDYRFQEFIEQWLSKEHLDNHFDRVAVAGGVFDFYTILKQIEIAHSLHHVKKVVLINHEDCGAYGKDSTHERHTHDLSEAKRKISALFPRLEVHTYYLHLDGMFEHV